MTRRDPMRLTKPDMARVIVLALYNLDMLPLESDSRVLQLARRKRETLVRQHKMALAAIASAARTATAKDEPAETTCITCGIEFTGEPDQTECDRCWGESEAEFRNAATDARHEAARDRQGD